MGFTGTLERSGKETKQKDTTHSLPDTKDKKTTQTKGVWGLRQVGNVTVGAGELRCFELAKASAKLALLNNKYRLDVTNTNVQAQPPCVSPVAKLLSEVDFPTANELQVLLPITVAEDRSAIVVGWSGNQGTQTGDVLQRPRGPLFVNPSKRRGGERGGGGVAC